MTAVCEICGKEAPTLQPYDDHDQRLHCQECGEEKAQKEEQKADFGRALESAQEKISEEQRAFERAVSAARMKKSFDLREQQMLDTFPEEDRGAVLAFVRWCAGQKWKGGPMVKMAAKAAFIQGFRIAEAAYGPTEEQKEAKERLSL